MAVTIVSLSRGIHSWITTKATDVGTLVCREYICQDCSGYSREDVRQSRIQMPSQTCQEDTVDVFPITFAVDTSCLGFCTTSGGASSVTQHSCCEHCLLE